MSSTHIPKRTVAVVDCDSDDLTVEDTSISPPHPPYNYTPLPRGDYFRLLELLPGEGDTTLNVNLAHYDLDAFNVPPYKALSYTWGESKYDRLIISGSRVPIDSVLRSTYDIRHPLYCGDKRLLISTNLRDALRRLRHRFLPIKLWVDAVCINQEDDAERSAQIMLMPRIYHHASPVTLWLGEEDEDTKPAFELLHLLAVSLVRIARLDDTNEDDPWDGLDVPERLRAMGLPPVESRQYGSLIRLFERPVFRRIWCVQEAAVSGTTTIICGDTTERPLPYVMMSGAIMALRMAGWTEKLQDMYVNGRDVLHFPEVVQSIQRRWFEHKLYQQRLAYDVRAFEATDPRDKVFALLGLVGDFAHRGLHQLLGSRDEDECKDGHAYDCPHWREQTRNWAQTKVESSEGFESLMYAANTRIYRLVDQLTKFFGAVMSLVAFMRDNEVVLVTNIEVSSKDIKSLGKRIVNDTTHLDELRATADDTFVDIRHTLDKMTNEFVSSDELAAYYWASHAIEEYCKDYDGLYGVYKSGRWTSREVEYIGGMFATIKRVDGLLREGSDYSPSHSSRESSSQEESQTAEDCLEEETHEEEEGVEQSEIVKEELPTHNESAHSSETGSQQIDVEASQPPSPAHVASSTAHAKDTTTAIPEPGLESLGDLQNVLGEEVDEPGEIKTRAAVDEEPFALSEDVMTVGKDEMPAEISLMAGSGGWDKVIGLEYMAPREPAERPVLTANPMPAWSPDLALLPNYGLSMEEVYRNFTVQCLVKNKSLDMLSTVDVTMAHQHNSLPSWVPDFRSPLSSNAQPIVYSDHLSRSTTIQDAEQEPEITWSPTNPQVLGLSGKFVDTIKAVSNIRSDPQGLKSLHEEWQSMSGLSYLTPTPSSRESTESMYRNVWKGEMGMPDAAEPGCPSTVRSWSEMIEELERLFQPENEQPEQLFGKPWESYFTFLCFLQVQQSGASTAKAIGEELVKSGVVRDSTKLKSKAGLLKAIEAIVVGRRIAYTELGHVVFVSEVAEVGDQICMFKGAKVPFLVRRSNKITDDESHELLGECFSHTMMVDGFSRRLLESLETIKLV